MTEQIINLKTQLPDKQMNEWLGLNGIDPATVLASELTIHDGQITYTEFLFIYEEGKPRYKVMDRRTGQYKKHHRTVPMIVSYVRDSRSGKPENDEGITK